MQIQSRIMTVNSRIGHVLQSITDTQTTTTRFTRSRASLRSIFRILLVCFALRSVPRKLIIKELLTEKYFGNIVIKYKDDQQNQYHQSDLLGNFAHLYTDRTFLNGFNDKKQQMAPIQNGDR